MQKILVENIAPDIKIIKTVKRWIKMSFLPNETTFDKKIKILKNYGIKEVYINPDKDNSSFKKVTDFLINLDNNNIELDNYVGTLVLLNTGKVAIVFEVNRKEQTRPKVIILSDENKTKKIPNLFDLAEYNLLTEQYCKSILSAIDPRP